MIPQNLIDEYELHNISVYDIARVLNRTATSVYYELKRLKLDTNYYKIKTKERNEAIVKQYKEGKKQVEIAKVFDLSKQRVSQIIKRNSNGT